MRCLASLLYLINRVPELGYFSRRHKPAAACNRFWYARATERFIPSSMLAGLFGILYFRYAPHCNTYLIFVMQHGESTCPSLSPPGALRRPQEYCVLGRFQYGSGAHEAMDRRMVEELVWKFGIYEREAKLILTPALPTSAVITLHPTPSCRLIRLPAAVAYYQPTVRG